MKNYRLYSYLTPYNHVLLLYIIKYVKDKQKTLINGYNRS